MTIRHLSGGGNNHLFRSSTASRTIVIKRYREQNFGAKVARRDAEITLLRHAAAVAPAYVPQLVGTHGTLGMIAMTAIEGVPYQSGEAVSAADLQAAVSFYRELNADQDRIREYPVSAREGFLSIAEHILHIEDRLSRLNVKHLPVELRVPAQRVLDEVRASFDSLVRTAETRTPSSALWGNLDPDLRQVSPGDFGFHNAVRGATGPVFIDFEYAGTDDPAKTLADFFLQPKVPVDAAAFDMIASAFAVRIPEDYLKRRAWILGRVLSFKWKSIILGPLDPARFPSFEIRHSGSLATKLLARLYLAERQTLFD